MNPIWQSIEECWPEFVDQWCLGSPPALTAAEVQHAIHALIRHAPAWLEESVGSGRRGLLVIAQVVHLGRVLAATEHLLGFSQVLARVLGGESSAWAELEFAASIEEVGLRATLEPPMCGRVLDCSFEVAGSTVYVEVIYPSASDVMKKASSSMHRICNRVADACPGDWVNIVALQPPHLVENELAAAAIAAPVDGTLVRTEHGAFRKTKLDGGASHNRISDCEPTLRPALIHGVTQVQGQDILSKVELEFSLADRRMQRLLAAELHHFTKAHINVIAVKVNGILGGIGQWEQLARAWFTPLRNTRIGGVLLWETALCGSPMSVQCAATLITNPHATQPLPDAAADALRSLHHGTQLSSFATYG